MKKYLALVISSFLLAGPVSAEVDFKKLEAIELLARKLLLEAESQAMEQCATTRIVVPLPHYSINLIKRTWREETIEKSVSIEWSGGCVEGKRDGVGILSWVEEWTNENHRKNELIFRSEGRFVKGQRLGLWCGTSQYELGSRNVGGGCSIIAGHAKPPLTGSYRKQPDGSWQEYVHDAPGASSLAAGVLEAHSEKVLADASSGKTDLKVELDIQSHALDDLVRGSKIVLAPSSTPISLKDKRVALVLSSQMISELERFKLERQALIDASAGLSGDAAAYRAKFIHASNPDRVLVNIIKILRRYTKDVQPADDLAGLKKGSFDYALVVDWKYKTRFDLLGKYNSFLGLLAFQSLGGYLINRDLKAVKQLSLAPDLCGSDGSKPPSDYDPNGDRGYMWMLTECHESAWGRSEDIPGFLFLGLNGGLKEMQ